MSGNGRRLRFHIFLTIVLWSGAILSAAILSAAILSGVILPGELMPGDILSSALVQPVQAAGVSDYDQGVRAYQVRNYKVAAQYFRRSVAGPAPTALAWLYLGHACLGSGDNQGATDAYRTVCEKFSSTPEAQLSLQCLQKINPAAAAKVNVTSGAPTSTTPMAEGRKESLSDRIIVYPPKFGHPAVGKETIAVVRDVVKRLSPQMYKYLSDGGATVNIVPNIEDKWPGSGDGFKPNDPSSTMGEEPGRTYGHDVHVYERAKVRGSNVLLEARNEDEIRRVTFHELGHAVDEIAGGVSKTKPFTAALEKDLEGVPSRIKEDSKYFIQPGEAFAETTGEFLGSTSANEIVDYFHSVKQLIKNKFHF